MNNLRSDILAAYPKVPRHILNMAVARFQFETVRSVEAIMRSVARHNCTSYERDKQQCPAGYGGYRDIANDQAELLLAVWRGK